MPSTGTPPGELRRALARAYPWAKAPFIVGAPMRVLSGPRLAVAVSQAGGLGFIGPTLKSGDLVSDLEEAAALIRSSSRLASASTTLHVGDHGPRATLPVGVGFQTWNSDVAASLAALEKHQPCAVWLFAPRRGQSELDEWVAAVRRASPSTKIWIQVGTLREATDAVGSPSPPDVLVIQGAEAGGHGRAADGMGTMALFPEVSDATRASGIPLVAAGGIVDGRGVAAALSLGAAGVAMGTRMLASAEARISRGYQDEVVRAADGASSTVRTQLYNHLRGTFGWPEQFSPRGVINRSWIEHQEGVPFDELKKRHDRAAAEAGDAAWGPEGRLATYAGAAVGLVRSVDDAATIVDGVRREAKDIVTSLTGDL
ncbi:2-nitropropane dioxygenase precursor [Purpureocillium lavendulum]|uniref:2-nitropropane dioxygenase n=1 Tax=Purpureocillium lavendulum TaxID=1247861 RepID=A0AB34FWY6_9HYPO|nr:2-nitropropane dioxygenase precursor [Purpureocillium lavendulum]